MCADEHGCDVFLSGKFDTLIKSIWSIQDYISMASYKVCCKIVNYMKVHYQVQ